MRILMRSYVEDYKIAVAKISFLETYGIRYFFIDNLDKTSMLVIDEEDYNKKKQISLLCRPNNLQSEYPLSIFYLRNEEYKLKQNKFKTDTNIETLSDEFKECFKNNLNTAFFNPDKFFKDKAKKEYAKIILTYVPSLVKIDEAIEDFENAEIFENYLKKFNEGLLFKYSSKDIEETRKNNGGSLSFCHPKKFNDPFDCNCSFKGGKDAVNKFRVLCLTKEYNNILMWSHYGDEHKGYCYGYRFDDLCKIISSLKFNFTEEDQNKSCLVILGDVTYTTKRPKQRSSYSSFTWADINHYINACFTKFKDWEYEKEVRFVIMSNQPMPDFLEINPDPAECYRGCESGEDISLSKSSTQYILY